VIDTLLTDDFGGVLVTDFYAAYDQLPGLKQRCWAHTWRDIDVLEHEFPEEAVLAAWVAGVRAICQLATGPRPIEEAGTSPQARRARAARARQYEQQHPLLCPQTLPADRPEATLAKRFRRYADELFTVVRELDVPPTKSAAERSLRPLVIARNVSGGTRSAAGSMVRMTLASLTAMAPLQGDNPTDVFLQLLTAPDVSPCHTP
jgi:transposase